MKTTRLRYCLLNLAFLFLALGQATGQSIQFSASTLPVDAGGYGHGASFGAYTRNGRPSIFVISYGTANYLYDNIGGYFNDIAGSAGVQFGTDHDRGMAAADYDNDGDIDIYISAGYTGNVFWRNNGDDTFTDITSSSGTYLNGQGQGVAWGDVNNDGSLDLFVCQTEGGNRLFIQGGGRFYEAGNFSAESGSLQPVFFDVNNDGHVDLLVTRRSGLNNLLYINGGGGGFDEQAGSWRIGHGGADSQGATAGDYDRDGDLDVFICNYTGANLLFRNMGGYFEEAGGAAGVQAGADGNRGAVFGDFNDDGWPDIYVVRSGDNKMFRNNGNGTFAEVSGASGAGDGNDGYSPSIADHDNDGDLDIFFTNTGQNSVLLQNQGPFNNWIEFRLRGSGSN
ncbi:MAG: FG-GAP repeat domain-containing protein, partial [bacterium]